MAPTATSIVHCHPRMEHLVIRAGKSTINDQDVCDILGLRLGDFDEAPVNRVEFVSLGRGEVEVQVYGNAPYFDGEIDIMTTHCTLMAERLKRGLW